MTGPTTFWSLEEEAVVAVAEPPAPSAAFATKWAGPAVLLGPSRSMTSLLEPGSGSQSRWATVALAALVAH